MHYRTEEITYFVLQSSKHVDVDEVLEVVISPSSPGSNAQTSTDEVQSIASETIRKTSPSGVQTSTAKQGFSNYLRQTKVTTLFGSHN